MVTPSPLLLRLGLAYAGSNREDVLSLLLPVMGDSKSNMEVSHICVVMGIHTVDSDLGDPRDNICLHVLLTLLCGVLRRWQA